MLRFRWMVWFACLLSVLVLAPPLTAQSGMKTLPVATSSVTSSVPSAPVTVSGRVVSATTGLPVFRALVRLNDRAVLSDHEGKFEFPQYSASTMNNLQVTKPGYYSSSFEPMSPETVSLRADQLAQTIEVRLYPEALLTGTITKPDGTPLSHINVSARRSVYTDQNHRWLPVGQAITDSRGNFRIPIPPGDYRLQTTYSAHNGSTSEAILPLSVPANSERSHSDFIHVVSGAQEHFDLHPLLSRTYAVNVAIDSSNDRGFPMITARSGDGLTFPAFSSGRPMGPGAMRLELPSGTYTLMAIQNGQDGTQYGEATVTVTNRDVDNVVLHLAAVSPIPVEMIVDSDSTSDKTPPNVQQLGVMLESTADSVSAQPEGMMVSVMMTRDQSASFHVMPGTYHLMAHGMGAWFIKSASYGTTDLLDKDLTVSAGTSGDTIRLTVSNQTGSLKGTTSLSGTPSSCWIYLSPTGPSAASVFTSRSGQDGSYTFSTLPPGSYHVVAFEQRYSANFRATDTLDKFAGYIGTVTISSGNKASLDLNAVPAKESHP